MDSFRKIGIAIVMIVPAFVIGGMVWAVVQSWIAVFLLEILLAGLYAAIVSGKLSRGLQKA